MLSLIAFVINAVLVAAVGTIFTMKYRAAQGSVWQRVMAATHDSASMLWNYILIFSADLLVWSEGAAQFFNLPEVDSFLKTNVQPKYIGSVVAGIAVVGIVARLRGLIKMWKEAAA